MKSTTSLSLGNNHLEVIRKMAIYKQWYYKAMISKETQWELNKSNI